MKTFKELTKKFDYINPDIESNFPLEEVAKNTEYKLFHFNRDISSKEAIEQIKNEGYMPATLSHLLYWKEWNEKNWIIALGSVGKVDGYRVVPGLDRSGSKRSLNLRWFGGAWGADCRFLGVRNLSSESSISETPALVPLDTLPRDQFDRIEKKLNVLLNHFGIK